MLVSLPLLRYVISRTECVLWLVNFTGGILSSAFRLSLSGAEIFSFLRGEKCNKKVIYLFFLDLHVRYKIVFSIFVFVLFYIIFAPVYDSLRPVRLIKAFGQSRSLTKALGKGLGQIVLSVVSGPTPTPSYARAERNRTALIPIYPSFKKTFYQFRIKTVVFFPKTNSIDSLDSKLTFLERKICYVGQKLFLPEVIRRRFLLGRAGRLHLYDIFSLKYFRSKSTNLELQEKAPVKFRNWFSHIHKTGVGYLHLNFRDRYLTK